MHAYCFDDTELGRIETIEWYGDFGLGLEIKKVN